MPRGLALTVFAVGVIRFHGWALFPAHMQGAVSKALDAATTLVLLYVIAQAFPFRLVYAACGWWAFEACITLGFAVAYAIHPWPVAPGQSIASALLGFDLGTVTVPILAIVGAYLVWPQRATCKV
jgi:hypothetical protein